MLTIKKILYHIFYFLKSLLKWTVVFGICLFIGKYILSRGNYTITDFVQYFREFYYIPSAHFLEFGFVLLMIFLSWRSAREKVEYVAEPKLKRQDLEKRYRALSKEFVGFDEMHRIIQRSR